MGRGLSGTEAAISAWGASIQLKDIPAFFAQGLECRIVRQPVGEENRTTPLGLGFTELNPNGLRSTENINLGGARTSIYKFFLDCNSGICFNTV